MLASVYDGNWFFVTNDLAELKSIIDRADGRFKRSRCAPFGRCGVFRGVQTHALELRDADLRPAGSLF